MRKNEYRKQSEQEIAKQEELYKELVEDILARDIPIYNNLYIFVHNLVYGKIVRKCNTNDVLRGGRHADDVMQLIQIRIVKKCEDRFFKPVDGKTDKTCLEFKKWCHAVANNCFRSYYNSQIGKKGNNGEQGVPKEGDPDGDRPLDGNRDISLSTDDNYGDEETSATDETRKGRPKKVSIAEEGKNAPSVSGGYDKIETLECNRSKLKECFEVVLDIRSGPHIVMTWLFLSSLIINLDMRKKDATHLLIKTAEELTLREMLVVVLRMMSVHKLIDVDENWKEKQLKKLETVDSESGKMIGNMKYSDFYMKKGAEASVSDWFNKISRQITKRVDPDWGHTQV